CFSKDHYRRAPEAEMIDAGGGEEAAGGMAAKRSDVRGEDDGDGIRDAVLPAFLHAIKVQQSLDAPAAIGGGDVGGVEIAGVVAGMIEMIDFANVEFAAG